MERNYVGDQMVVCAAGNVDHDALVDIADNRFHTLRADGAPVPEKAHYVGGEQRLMSDHEQAHIVLGFEGSAYNSDGFYAAQILASILGGGMSSRLFQEVREKRGLCYSVYAFHWAFADSGIFGVAASTGEDEVTDLLPVVARRTAEGHRDHHRRGGHPRPQPDPRRPPDVARKPDLACRPARAPADPLGPHHSAAGNGDRINRITADRVKQIARQILDKGRFSLAGIGPVAKLPTTTPSQTGSKTSADGDAELVRGDPTPVLTGPRVVLRPPRSRDYPAWRDLRRKSREVLKSFEPRWTDADLNRQAYGMRLLRGRQEARKGTDFSFLVFERTARATCWSVASPSPTSAAARRNMPTLAIGWARSSPAAA